MKIVIPCDNNMIAENLIDADCFRFYVINNEKVIMKKNLLLSESGLENAFQLFNQYMINVIICDRIDPSSASYIAKTEYTILSEVSGDPDEAVDHLLYDELIANDHPATLEDLGCGGDCSACSSKCSDAK